MAKKKKITPAGAKRRRRPRSVGKSPVLAELARRYARFRRKHPRGARIPSELRAATLAALEKGVSPSELHRSCGVSWNQVAAWRAARSTGDRVAREGDDATDVRVFSVVDEPALEGGAPKLEAGREAELELRLGSWSVTVRLADPGRTGGA